VAHPAHESSGNYLKLGLVSLGILILLGVASFLWRQGRQPETITTGGMAEMMVPAIVPEVVPGLLPVTGVEPGLSPESDLPGSRRSSLVATGEERDSGEPPIRASRAQAVPAKAGGGMVANEEATATDASMAVVGWTYRGGMRSLVQ